MSSLLLIATILAALGSGLIAGFFFAFSACVMAALRRLEPSAGIAAMQSINVVVLNPLFLGAFFGTALLSLVLAVVAALTWSAPGTVYLLAGSLVYLAGAILVTIVFNVPLNNRLAAVKPDSADGRKVWAEYLSTWTNWNHVRMAASLLAAADFIVAAALRWS
jgi:uncharacterized membrane protein